MAPKLSILYRKELGRGWAASVRRLSNPTHGLTHPWACMWFTGVRGVTVPQLFGLRGTVSSLFTQDEKILSPAVNMGDLRRLKYNKTIFGRGSAPDPAHDALTDPRVEWGGILPPHSPPLSSRDPRAPRSPSELVPPLLDRSYAPAETQSNSTHKISSIILTTRPTTLPVQ